jgi:hypothetical protein
LLQVIVIELRERIKRGYERGSGSAITINICNRSQQ